MKSGAELKDSLNSTRLKQTRILLRSFGSWFSHLMQNQDFTSIQGQIWLLNAAKLQVKSDSVRPDGQRKGIKKYEGLVTSSKKESHFGDQASDYILMKT